MDLRVNNIEPKYDNEIISGLFAIKASDLTDSTTLDSLNKTQITTLGLKKMEAYVKEALSEG